MRISRQLQFGAETQGVARTEAEHPAPEQALRARARANPEVEKRNILLAPALREKAEHLKEITLRSTRKKRDETSLLHIQLLAARDSSTTQPRAPHRA